MPELEDEELSSEEEEEPENSKAQQNISRADSPNESYDANGEDFQTPEASYIES